MFKNMPLHSPLRIASCMAPHADDTCRAIAAYLAKGLSLEQAVEAAKIYLTQALRHSDELRVGSGHGPVHHFWNQAHRG